MIYYDLFQELVLKDSQSSTFHSTLTVMVIDHFIYNTSNLCHDPVGYRSYVHLDKLLRNLICNIRSFKLKIK